MSDLVLSDLLIFQAVCSSSPLLRVHTCSRPPEASLRPPSLPSCPDPHCVHHHIPTSRIELAPGTSGGLLSKQMLLAFSYLSIHPSIFFFPKKEKRIQSSCFQLQIQVIAPNHCHIFVLDIPLQQQGIQVSLNSSRKV